MGPPRESLARRNVRGLRSVSVEEGVSSMRPVNILILVLAGALGGPIIMKVTERPRHVVSLAHRPVNEGGAPVQTAAAPLPPTPAEAPQTEPPLVVETPPPSHPAQRSAVQAA